MTSRRAFLTGLGAVICAPAIVRVSSLMGLPRAPLFEHQEWSQQIVWATSDEYRAELVRRWQFTQWVMGKNVGTEVFAQ